MVEVNIVFQYTMEYCTILVFYVGMRFELDYNDNLYYVDDMLRVYHSDHESTYIRNIMVRHCNNC